MIPQFIKQRFSEYEILDFKQWIGQEKIEIILTPKASRPFCCHRCGTTLQAARSKHLMQLEDLPIMNFKSVVKLWRFKGHCLSCNKQRSEAISFVCPESPHLTQEYGWWLGKLCEIAPISNAAKITGQQALTLWRHDFNRMKRMLQFYKIPPPEFLSVDEVYAKKKKDPGETRNDLFFTVISDLKTRKVIYVTRGRSKQALDEFYLLIGPQQCAQIKAVAMDQFDGFRMSTLEHCPNATVVLDKFHLIQNFNEAVNDVRKNINASFYKNTDMKRLTRGANKYIFLRKASRRNKSEQQLIDQLIEINEPLAQLEMIKEFMLEIFSEPDADSAWQVFQTIGSWIMRFGELFKPLIRWFTRLEYDWSLVKNYFKFTVSTALSEGINNVIKMLKRRAFGYRNMEYFRLKIMQKCGYLNSDHIPLNF